MSTNFEPPPTYASVVLYNEQAQDLKQLLASVRFNPIWLKWFVDVAKFITSAGGGSGTITHDDLSGLQGGSATERYHLTAAEHTAVGALGTISTQAANAVAITGGAIAVTGREQEHQGAAVTAANSLTLGADGNYFQVAGATQIDLLNSAGWQGGSMVTLKFNSTPTVKNNQAPSTTFKPVNLAGAADFVASALDLLTLRYDATDACWYEQSRSVN